MEPQEPVTTPIKTRKWPGDVLGGYALLCGLGAMLFASLYPPGWAAMTRPALGVVGVVAGLLFFLRDRWWKPLLLFWLAAQVPVIIVDPSGELTRQPGFRLNFIGQNMNPAEGPTVLEASGFGIEFAAVLLIIAVRFILANRWYRAEPGPGLFRGLAGALRVLPFVVVVSVAACVGTRWSKLRLRHDALLTLDCPFPGADIYAGDKKLGSTPLMITGDRLVEWGLNRPDAKSACWLNPTATDQGLALFSGNSSMEILFKAPDWCASHFQNVRTPWGIRAVPDLGRGHSSNYWSVPLTSQSQPGLVLNELGIEPSVCRPGQEVGFTVQLRHNPPDPRMRRPVPPLQGTRAELVVFFWHRAGYSSSNIELPLPWARLGFGQVVTHAFKVTAPSQPGTYTVHCKYKLTENIRRAGTYYSWIRTYGILEVQ
jgi:hypothetical protein